jgi:hypothetical protein
LGKPKQLFERLWRRSLHDGVVEGSAFSPRPVSVKLDAIAAQATKAANDEAPGAQGAKEQEIEIIFRPDPSVFDGRFANNGWLQELPKPLTKLTWDNAAVISPATAERLGLGYRFGFIGTVAHTDVVELHFRGRVVRAPVWILPGDPAMNRREQLQSSNGLCIGVGVFGMHDATHSVDLGHRAERLQRAAQHWLTRQRRILLRSVPAEAAAASCGHDQGDDAGQALLLGLSEPRL